MPVSISPINGHEIKHRESEKLNEDVEKFLKERELTVLPVAFKPKKLRTECKPFKPEVNWKYNPKAKKNVGYTNRLIEQSRLLTKYCELSQRYGRWKMIVDATNGLVTSNTLSQVATGQSFISDDGVWNIVKAEVEKLIQDIEK